MIRNVNHHIKKVNGKSKTLTKEGLKQSNRLTINGLTCSGFAIKSVFGLNKNDTLSPHGVLVT